MGQRLSKAYLLTKVLTASNEEVVIYLYEGAIGFLHRAATALRAERRGEAAEAIDRASHIIVELSGNLDYSQGGHLALRLDGIYNYLLETLAVAGRRGDLESLEACEGILVILHDAWQQAATMKDARPKARADRQLRITA